MKTVLNNLINSQVLITGASSGIGLACAERLLTLGCVVTGLARDFSKTTTSSLNGIEIDLSKLDELPSHLTRLDIAPGVLILAAGYGQFGGLEQFSYAQIQRMVEVNLLANLFLVKHFLPVLKQQGGGDIVLLGSEAGLSGAKQGAVYCATKFAQRGLAQSLRADLSGSNIRVMLINPGAVDTPFFDALHFCPQQGEEYALSESSVVDAIIAALSQPRNSVIEEINIQPLKRAFTKKKSLV